MRSPNGTLRSGGTIAKLGTAKHHREWLPKIDDLSLPGCFGMTEMAHGSNVMGIETQVRAARARLWGRVLLRVCVVMFGEAGMTRRKRARPLCL